MKKLNKKGFTIIELVIVIAVIAILAAVMVPTFSSIVDKANASAAEQDAKALYKEAMALDLLEDGFLNNDFGGSTAITEVSGGSKSYKINGGEPFTYKTNGTEVTEFSYESNGYKVTYTKANGWESNKK